MLFFSFVWNRLRSHVIIQYLRVFGNGRLLSTVLFMKSEAKDLFFRSMPLRSMGRKRKYENCIFLIFDEVVHE